MRTLVTMRVVCTGIRECIELTISRQLANSALGSGGFSRSCQNTQLVFDGHHRGRLPRIYLSAQCTIGGNGSPFVNALLDLSQREAILQNEIR